MEKIKNPNNNGKFKLLSDLGKVIKIEGGNVDASTGRLCLASKFYEILKKDKPMKFETMKKMEEEWIKTITNENFSKVTPLQIVDGKVRIPEGSLYHNLMFPTLDRIKSVSKYGVLCSENFGILESEGEGRFCAFFSRTISEPSRNQMQLLRKHGINFYFDTSNPIIQSLLALDYFEYERKKQNGESLKEYQNVVKDFFDNIVEPLSPAGKYMHEDNSQITYFWSAIPFGLPPELVNGIEIKPDILNKLEYSLDKIVTLFPKAVIFDKDKNILRRSFQSENLLCKSNE